MTDVPVDRRLPGGPGALLGRLLQPARQAIADHPRAAAAALGAWTLLLSGLALRSPALVIGVLLAGVLGVLVLRRPEAALCVLIFLIPFHLAIYDVLRARAHLNVGNVTLWKDVLLAALFVRGLVRQLAAGRRFNQMFVLGDRGVFAYGLLLALIASVSPSFNSAGYALEIVGEGPLLFLTIVLLRPSRRALRAILWAFLASAGVTGITAVIEQAGPKASFDPWFGGAAPQALSSFFLGDGSYRSGAFFTSPLQLAFFGAGSAALATGAALATRGWVRALAGLVAALSIAGVVVSFTRSGYVGGGIGVVVVLTLGVRRVGLRLALLGMVSVVALSAVALSVASGDQHLSHAGEGDAHLNALQADMNLFAYQPLGYGLGSVDAISQRFDRNSGFATESTLLAKALQGGIEELLAYLAILFWVAMRLRAARRAAMERGDGEAAALCAGALGVMWAVFIAGLFLGIEALPVELLLWGAPAIALGMVATPVTAAGPARRLEWRGSLRRRWQRLAASA
jgi:hypothetical protein